MYDTVERVEQEMRVHQPAQGSGLHPVKFLPSKHGLMCHSLFCRLPHGPMVHLDLPSPGLILEELLYGHPANRRSDA